MDIRLRNELIATRVKRDRAPMHKQMLAWRVADAMSGVHFLNDACSKVPEGMADQHYGHSKHVNSYKSIFLKVEAVYMAMYHEKTEEEIIQAVRQLDALMEESSRRKQVYSPYDDHELRRYAGARPSVGHVKTLFDVTRECCRSCERSCKSNCPNAPEWMANTYSRVREIVDTLGDMLTAAILGRTGIPHSVAIGVIGKAIGSLDWYRLYRSKNYKL